MNRSTRLIIKAYEHWNKEDQEEVKAKQIIAKEHSRLRALFEKKMYSRFDARHIWSREKIKTHNTAINDCLSELQDTKEERA